jgi:hypothetical protein
VLDLDFPEMLLDPAKDISQRRFRSISQIFEALVKADRQRGHVPLPVARSSFDLLNAKSAAIFFTSLHPPLAGPDVDLTSGGIVSGPTIQD